MASFSNYTENGVLNLMFHGTPFNIPGLYLGLFTSDAGLEENNIQAATEVPGGLTGYLRIDLNQFGGVTTATDGEIQNVATMDFPKATQDWGEITHTALLDSPDAANGNVICWGPVLNSRTVYIGDSVRVPAGAFIVTLS